MARHPAPQASSEKTLSRRVPVNIRRDMTAAIPKIVWQHELPILQALFGEVEDIDPAKLDEGFSPTQRPDMMPYNKTQDRIARPSESLGVGHVFIGNAEAEYDRLSAMYGRPSKEEDGKLPWVEKIYGRFQEGRFARLLGEPELADLPENQLYGLVLAYGYAPEPHKDAAPDEKNAAWAKRKALMTADKAALVKIAEEVGVEIG
jgi:hypothetical protein